MFAALRGGLSLAVLILVMKLFLPEVALGLIEIIEKMIDITNHVLDNALATLPADTVGF